VINSVRLLPCRHVINSIRLLPYRHVNNSIRLLPYRHVNNSIRLLQNRIQSTLPGRPKSYCQKCIKVEIQTRAGSLALASSTGHQRCTRRATTSDCHTCVTHPRSVNSLWHVLCCALYTTCCVASHLKTCPIPCYKKNKDPSWPTTACYMLSSCSNAADSWASMPPIFSAVKHFSFCSLLMGPPAVSTN